MQQKELTTANKNLDTDPLEYIDDVHLISVFNQLCPFYFLLATWFSLSLPLCLWTNVEWRMACNSKHEAILVIWIRLNRFSSILESNPKFCVFMHSLLHALVPVLLCPLDGFAFGTQVRRKHHLDWDVHFSQSFSICSIYFGMFSFSRQASKPICQMKHFFFVIVHHVLAHLNFISTDFPSYNQFGANFKHIHFFHFVLWLVLHFIIVHLFLSFFCWHSFLLWIFWNAELNLHATSISLACSLICAMSKSHTHAHTHSTQNQKTDYQRKMFVLSDENQYTKRKTKINRWPFYHL